MAFLFRGPDYIVDFVKFAEILAYFVDSTVSETYKIELIFETTKSNDFIGLNTVLKRAESIKAFLGQR